MEKYNTLMLFGNKYSREDLLAAINSPYHREDWEKEFWNFIASWINEKEYIEVKTSGSTGKPKQIRLSKQRMLFSAQMTVEFFKLKKGDQALLCMSPTRIGGMMMIVRAFYAQLDLHIVKPSSNPLSTINESFQFVAMVPYQVTSALDESPGKLRKINNVLIGGGAISEHLEKNIAKHQINAYHSFGMTETISHFALRKIGAESAFTCLANVKISLSPDGTMVVHAPLLNDSSIHTTDIVELESETSFTWIGRSDFAIESGGIKILPEKIEKLLSAYFQDRFFIDSIKHEKLNNQLVLIIEGEKREIKEDWFAELDKYHQPKKVFFLQEFINTKSGKIDRKATIKLLSN